MAHFNNTNLNYTTMTKFTTMGQDAPKQKKKTVFKTLVSWSGSMHNADYQVEAWNNVKFLWTDKHYGDVFIAWKNGGENSRVIYFGEKGDEFD